MLVKNQTLQRDFLTALYLHAIVIMLILGYLMLSDLLHSWFVKRPLPPTKSVEIEFVTLKSPSVAPIEPIAQRRSASQEIQPQPISPKGLSKTNISEKNQMPHMKIPKMKSLSPEEKRSKPFIPSKPSISAAKRQVPKQGLDKVIQRQASVVSKSSRVSVAKQVFLDKAVGEKAVGRRTAKDGSARMKADHRPNDGAIKQTNAQVLGSKTVQSSAKRRVAVSTVKKTTEQLRPDAVVKKTLPQKSASIVKSPVPSDGVAKQLPVSNDAKVVSKTKKAIQQPAKGASISKTVAEDAKKNQDQSRAVEASRLEKEKQRRMAEDVENKRQAALEAEKKRQAEAKRLADEAEKSRQIALKEARARKAQLEEEKRQARLAHENAVISEYGQMIITHIQRHAVFNTGMDGYRTNLKIKLAKSGDVLSVALVGTSGNTSFDQLAINAVYKASPLPLPEDDSIVEKMQSINLMVSPSEMHH